MNRKTKTTLVHAFSDIPTIQTHDLLTIIPALALSQN